MEDIAPVRQSYGRCVLNPNFFDMFYDDFLESNPVIKPLFSRTDFTAQKQALHTSLGMLLAHLDGKESGTIALDRIALNHSKGRLNIHPSLYQLWIDSLIRTIKQCDPKYSPELECGWKKTLRTGVDYISAQYDVPVS